MASEGQSRMPAQVMEVDYSHVDVNVVSAGGIKPGDVLSASIPTAGPPVMLMADKSQRAANGGQIEPWSMDEDSECLLLQHARALFMVC